jgi:hypothetical protein
MGDGTVCREAASPEALPEQGHFRMLASLISIIVPFIRISLILPCF